jgi:Zn-dependent protease/predicted transcriptional regulator
MFGKQLTLFTIFDFKVRIDLSWIIIAVLVTWSLATGLFPFYYRGLSTTTYWTMGLIGAIGLFASIIFHELWHSLVARKFGLPIKEITLFIFGGVANMEDEPASAKAELWMALAGPAASLVLSGIFYVLSALGHALALPIASVGVLSYLSGINAILAVFNLIPAFPLDGGRVLRAALWNWKNNLKWATRLASNIGAGFGIFLIVMGVFTLISGSLIGGFWWILIGMFVVNASRMSYQKLLIRRSLEGEPVRRFMKTDPVTVAPSLTVQQLVEEYIYKYHFKMFPVAENQKPVSCVTTRQVKEIPREEWDEHTVEEIAAPCSDDNTISAETDAMKALSLIHRTQASRLMVVDQTGQLVGILALKDLLQFLSLKMDLEEDAVVHV